MHFAVARRILNVSGEISVGRLLKLKSSVPRRRATYSHRSERDREDCLVPPNGIRICTKLTTRCTQGLSTKRNVIKIVDKSLVAQQAKVDFY